MCRNSPLAYPTFHKACQVNLAELSAHEMTHCLQANKYGLPKFNPFKHPERWKLEGYPEYIARQPELSVNGYNFKADIDRSPAVSSTIPAVSFRVV
jgi:hypothetical protein